MTALSDIPSLPDGAVLPILSGKIERVFDVKTGKTGKGKAWKRQGFIIEMPSGKMMVETFIQSLFVTPEDVGKDFQWYSSKTEAGYVGILKRSYITKCPEGENPDSFVPEKKHSISLEQGARLTPPTAPLTPMPPDHPVTPQPTPPTPMQPPKSMLPAPSNAITRLAKQWKMCFDAVKAVNPEFTTAELLPPTATVFIEAQRSGVKEFAAQPVNKLPDQPTPASGNEPVAKENPNPEESQPPKPAAVKPKFTVAQLAAKIDAGEKVKPSDLDGVPLRALWDWVFAEAKHTIGLKYLDAVYMEKQKQCEHDEVKYLTKLLCNWQLYLDAAKKLEDEDKAMELTVEADV